MKNKLKLLPLLLLFSCSESAQSLIDNHHEDAQLKFDQMYACYDLAIITPPTSKNEIKWKSNDANTEYGSSNVYQIGIESFKDLSAPLDIELDGTRRREHADMAKLFNIDLSSHLQSHEYEIDNSYAYQDPSSGESCANAINHFLDAKYLLINRLLEHSAPKYIGQDIYEPGYIKGDVLVFDLESTKLLGGFKIEVKSQEQISLHQNSDVNANLMADLGMKAYRSIIEKFVALTPSCEDISFDF